MAPAAMSEEAGDLGGYYSRRNFYIGLVNGSLWIFGMALIDPDTVLPAFALDMTGSVVGVAILAAAINAGWAWPSVFLTGRMTRTKRWLRYYRITGTARLVFMWAVVAAVAIARRDSPIYLWIVGALLLAFTSAGGAGQLPFASIVSETIPARMRGRFFGTRFLVGGMLSLGGSFFVKKMLSAPWRAMFPSNYLYLFIAAAVFITISLTVFFFAEERPHEPRRRQLPAMAHLRMGGRLVLRDQNYRRLLMSRVLLGATSGISFPFIVPFALQKLGIPTEAVAVFLIVRVLAYSASNVLWSYLSDGPGNRILLLMSGLCYLLVPGLMLIAPQMNTSPGALFLGVQTSPALWWMLLVFAVLGVASAGQDIGQMAYLLEMSPEGSRPTYLALYYLLGVPLAMLPLVGAAIIGHHGRYEIGFATSLIMVSAMVWVLQGLGEVRAKAKA